MTLRDLGQDIRKKREETGLTIEDVASRIKVSARTLHAIEAGTQENLPHAVYTKGFVRSYALLIGFDCAELNQRLETIFPLEALDNSRQELGPMVGSSSSSGAGRKIFILFLLLLLLFGIGAGGWYIFKTYGDAIWNFVKQPFSAVTAPVEPVSSETSDAAAPSGPLVSENEYAAGDAAGKTDMALLSRFFSSRSDTVQAGSQPPEAVAEVPENAASPPGVSQADTEGSALVGTSSVSETNETAASLIDGAPLSAPEPEAAVPLVSEITPAPAEEKFLTVVIEQRCWIGFRTDGARAQEITLNPGHVWVFPFTSSLEITLGNAAGATFYYDGKKTADLGRRGEVKTFRFP